MFLLIAALLPGAMLAFFFVVELPIGLKYQLYKMPTWLLSTLLNILIVTPLSGWLVGPLAVFVGEFIVWPALAIDSKRTKKIVETLQKHGIKIKLLENNKSVMEKYHRYKLRSDGRLLRVFSKFISKFTSESPPK